jgi:hypothetical protein
MEALIITGITIITDIVIITAALLSAVLSAGWSAVYPITPWLPGR